MRCNTPLMNSWHSFSPNGRWLAEAVSELRKAVDLDPAHPQSHYNLGLVLSQRGATDEAIQEWRKTLELSPKYAEAEFRLGEAAYLGGRNSEALAHWRQDLRLQPGGLPVLNQAA